MLGSLAHAGKSGLEKIKLNSEGVVALLNDPGVAADIRRRAEAFASAAEGEWAVTESVTDRAGANVRTADLEAMQAAAENPANVLAALSAARE